MQCFEVKNTNDFGIFRKVIQGCFNSKNLPKSFEYTAFNLVKHAYSGVFYSAPTKEEAIKNINKEDFLLDGFRDLNDFSISYEYNCIREIFEANATPLKIYKLNENFGVPFPINSETRAYLEFMADQLERVKIRAQNDLSNASTPEYATRFIILKLQVLDNLFNDSKNAFFNCCTKSNSQINETELYMLFVLNLCIIHSIVIYSKSFKAFLSEKPPSEKLLRFSFTNDDSRIPNYSWLYKYNTPINNVLDDYDLNPQAFQSHNADKKTDLPQNTNNSIKQTIESRLSSDSYDLVLINCPVTDFVTKYYNFICESNKNSELDFLDQEVDLSISICNTFADKFGNPLNPVTVSSYIRRLNADKRASKSK